MLVSAADAIQGKLHLKDFFCVLLKHDSNNDIFTYAKALVAVRMGSLVQDECCVCYISILS